MTLRLFERIALLLRADAHGVVDALEERSLLLKQALRDAELDLLEKRAHIEALEREEARVRERAARCADAIAALDEDVELALAGAREELARFAIRRLLPLRAERAGLECETAALAASRGALAERVADQEREFEDLRARVRARLSHDQSAASLVSDFGPPPVDDAEVELELLRRRGAASPPAASARGEDAR